MNPGSGRDLLPALITGSGFINYPDKRRTIRIFAFLTNLNFPACAQATAAGQR